MWVTLQTITAAGVGEDRVISPRFVRDHVDLQILPEALGGLAPRVISDFVTEAAHQQHRFHLA